MKKIAQVLLVSWVVLISLQSAAFAAYGGGGGASSITKSSVMLQRDVCPDGDYSGSWYDGICDSPDTVYTPTGFTYQSADTETTGEEATSEEATTDVSSEPEKQVDTWIVERKTELMRTTTVNETTGVKDLPLRYRTAQKQIDQIMATWNRFDPEVRDAKAIRLLKRIDTLLGFEYLSDKLRTILIYIQDKAVMMTSFPTV